MGFSRVFSSLLAFGAKMAEFPLPVLQIWRSRKQVPIQIQLMNIHVSECKYYCLHLVPKFGDMCDRQNWRLHPTGDVAVAMCDCGSPRCHKHILIINILLLCTPIDKRHGKHKLCYYIWRSFCSSSYRVWDSERPLGAGCRLVKSAIKVLRESRSGAAPLSGIHRSESSP